MLCLNCRADRFTAILKGGSPSESQVANCRQAVFRTKSPIGRISPVSSAIGMNMSGGTRPRRGCCQRISASTPTTRPVVMSICG